MLHFVLAGIKRRRVLKMSSERHSESTKRAVAASETLQNALDISKALANNTIEEWDVLFFES